MNHLVKQLMHLVTVIEEGSLSRAAEKLNLTQPALSRSIRHLEREVDGRVLERGRQGATPTELGRRLFVHGRNVQASLNRAGSEVQVYHQDDAGHFAIGSTSLPSIYFVPDAISSFLAERPNVALRFVVHSKNELVEMLRRGDIDIFVGARGFEAPPDGVETTDLVEESQQILCGPHHPLLGRKRLTAPQLSNYAWVLPPSTSDTHRQVQAAFSDAGLTDIRVAIETEATTGAIVSFLNRSDYLAIHSALLLEPDITAGRLKVLPLTLPGTRGMLTAFHRPEEELTNVERRFLAHLRSEARQLGGEAAKS